MRTTEVNRQRTAIIAPISGLFRREARRATFWLEAGLCPRPLPSRP